MSYYGRANIIAQATVGSIGTTEVDVLSVTNQVNLVDTQLNVYYDVTRGTHTTMRLRYYVRFAPGGDWFELPFRNEGTGVIASVPTIVDSATPQRFLDSLPLPACVAFRITATGVGGAGGSVTATLMSRDN